MCSRTYTSPECTGAFRFCVECDTEEKIKDLYEYVARGVESLVGGKRGGPVVPSTDQMIICSLQFYVKVFVFHHSFPRQMSNQDYESGNHSKPMFGFLRY